MYGPWIGLVRAMDGSLSWSDESALDFENWEAGEPNSTPGNNTISGYSDNTISGQGTARTVSRCTSGAASGMTPTASSSGRTTSA